MRRGLKLEGGMSFLQHFSAPPGYQMSHDFLERGIMVGALKFEKKENDDHGTYSDR